MTQATLVEFGLLFAASADARVGLAPIGTQTPAGTLGDFDLVSGGAIIQCTLFALGFPMCPVAVASSSQSGVTCPI